jgi:hypothetical protein
MDIKESIYAICSHSNPLETSHNKPYISVSSYTVGNCCGLFIYAYWYTWLMHNKDTSVGVDTQDVLHVFS